MDKYSFLNAAHTSFFEELYEKYLRAPDSIEPSWRAFFQGFNFGIENGNGFLERNKDVAITDNLNKEFLVIKLIEEYRIRGHLFTKTNPLRQRKKYLPTLAIENHNLSNEDLDTIFNAGDIVGIGASTLREIIKHLEEVYCTSIGVEYMYIRNVEIKKWVFNQLAINNNLPKFLVDEKKHILKKLAQAYNFETFLHTKYVGQKRFSLEGSESLIPALDAIIEEAANKNVKEFVVGMAHRGRLNTLHNIFGKPSKDIFSEFEGKDYSDLVGFDGDVKYHLGWASERKTDKDININMNLAPNPSHLEAVGAIVEGITRSKIENKLENDASKILPIIIHGDAAIAGQGMVYEIVQMANLEGYKTGGTIHIVVNNQIGFTTNYLDGRSSTYCTDIAKVTLAPVLHVNADDVEAVVHASLFALNYKLQFQKDVFIDLLGYRKYGHNEGDEPRFTQPKLYSLITKHKNPKDIYAEKLIAEKVITKKYLEELEKNYRQNLEKKLEDSRNVKKIMITPFMKNEWEGFIQGSEKNMLEKIDTKVTKNSLDKVAKVIFNLPEGKNFLRKIQKLIEERKNIYFEKKELDWGTSELLAYGTLLQESFNVRISGQDVERGTFSHRHAVLTVDDLNKEKEEKIILLNNISSQQGKFSIYNSPLSEYGVLGFDYGYAMASPNTLTIWEAQFGDFSNGAQIVIDQYISSAEDKWKAQNGIVLLLPHGYEGQGAEHSSGRIERYLQLCAKDNMYIANCSTPANFFHLLRRQMKVNFRKPLIIFTPKSLLRHSKVISPIKDFTEGGFEMLIPDNKIAPSQAKSLVFCTGKFYYDLLQKREEKGRNDVALVRLEQIYPLPLDEINVILDQYKNVKDIVWAQEEPRNMGVWGYLLLHFPRVSELRPATQRFYSAPASGSPARFLKRHNEVMEYVFDKTKDNFN